MVKKLVNAKTCPYIRYCQSHDVVGVLSPLNDRGYIRAVTYMTIKPQLLRFS